MTGVRTTGAAIAAAAVYASGMNRSAAIATGMETAAAHAAAMKSAAATKASTSATAGEGIIWSQTGSDENGCRETDQTEANHGALLLVR